jgi:hypothetical protein
MTPRRLLVAAAFALIAAAIPVTTEADAAFRVGLSTASCAEASCGSLSLADCFCPDMQFPNRRPRCDDPLAD